MKKEKFIEKILEEMYGNYYVKFFPYRYKEERQLIEKAMQYLNWRMFFWGFVLGVFINIIFDFIIL